MTEKRICDNCARLSRLLTGCICMYDGHRTEVDSKCSNGKFEKKS